MIEIGPLYHWSPKSRRSEIFKQGLVIGSESVVSTAAMNYICFGVSPRIAWNLSGDMEWVQEESEWDLWEVELSSNDDVHIRCEWGPGLREIRVHNSIPPDRVWWTGEREPWLTTPGGIFLGGKLDGARFEISE